MPTKTISLELDAYERLAAARHRPRESFSSVVRRARWDEDVPTTRKVLEDLKRRMTRPELQPDENALDSIDRTLAETRRSPSEWTQ